MHLRNQKDIVRSLSPSVAPYFPSLRQSAVVHVNDKEASRVLLTRGAAGDEAGSQDPIRFVKPSLYQFGVDRPDLVKFFAVPTGLQVVVDGPRIGVLGMEGGGATDARLVPE